MKVLVSAYACEPDKGSEPGVGWNWVKAISREHEVWVLTRGNNRKSIESELSVRPLQNVHFQYADIPKIIGFWKKGQRGIRIYYYLWQFFALAKAIKLNRKIRFDLGHHVTFVNDWIWTFFALMPIPFVWGPIGSHPKIPPQLLPNNREKVFDRLRFLFQEAVRLFDPLFWLSAIRSRTVLAINLQTLRVCPLRWLARNKHLIEPAIGLDIYSTTETTTSKDYVNFLYVGRFVSLKGPHLAVEAFSRATKQNALIRLTLLGEGSQEAALKKSVVEAGVANKVRFISWLPRGEALKEMNDTDVFLFPSTEGGGMVVLEALAAGKPVICLDYGGPGEFVTGESGIKVNIDTMEKTIDSLCSAIVRLAKDTDLRGMLSIGARKRASYYSWENKVTIVNRVYNAALRVDE